LGGAGVVQSVYNSLNELVGTGPGGNVLYQGTTNKPVKSNTLSSSVISLTANPTRQSTTYTGGATDFQGAVTFGANQGNYGNTTASIFYESPASENFYITTYNPALPGGQETVNYPVAGGTAAQVATNLAALMTADSKLQSIGLSATASGTVITITINNPTYTASTSSGATERFTVGPNFNAPNTAGTACSVGVQGTVTAGDTVSLTVNYPALSGGQYTTPAYTVQSPDTLASIASALSSKIISGTPLQAANVNVTSSVTVPLTAPTSQSFSGSPTTVAGGNTEAISATDGGNNTQTNFYQLPVNNQPTTSLTYDFNGNMTSDGTNTYQWDAENRLIQVNYPTGANSQFTYDGLNRCVKIVETTGSTKQFIWDQATICEARDGSGSVLNQYFKYGQTLAGSPYYFALDHLGSIRLLSDGSGNVQAEYDYDPFGRKRKLQGSVDADFQYAGYYYHSATGLSLTWHRAYAPSIGRWLSRDPATAEFGTPNPFLYAENDPASLTDPTGLDVRVFKTDENTYEFDLYILFVGETKLVSKFVQGIAYYWSGHFGKYCITTKVIQAADKSGNTITVKKNGLVNDTLIPGPTGTWTEQAMGIFTPSWGAAHEAGHLMGLQDTYAANTPGLGFGIMGGAPGTRPTEDEVKQILDRFSF
jgi:RHS repeat-associated protein